MSKPFSIRARIRSFKYAFRGIWLLIREEHNFRIHMAATAIVIFLGFYLKVTATEWRWLIFCIGMVITAEGFNSAIEKLTDLKQPEHDPKAGKIKDIAAGTVLLTALTTIIIAVMIFGPYIQDRF
ncbi:MAG: diacylglycerol kinase family protein [Roseivirga sp.]|nr:diacylglycerol kinase family protein [Roseivirga sp.]